MVVWTDGIVAAIAVFVDGGTGLADVPTATDMSHARTTSRNREKKYPFFIVCLSFKYDLSPAVFISPLSWVGFSPSQTDR
jgi:hypothetical protein